MTVLPITLDQAEILIRASVIGGQRVAWVGPRVSCPECVRTRLTVCTYGTELRGLTLDLVIVSAVEALVQGEEGVQDIAAWTRAAPPSRNWSKRARAASGTG